MADPKHSNSAPDDIKDKMREALERKRGGGEKGVHEDAPVHEKARGSEIAGKNAGPQNTMHRRKAGGGGA